MKALWFVVPVHGRLPLATICLRQLKHTCDQLAKHDIAATAVVVADGENLSALRHRLDDDLLGFATVERDNTFLSRRFNDGIQLALDSLHNRHPADYVVPCGSDDWIDYRILVNLPPATTVIGFQHLSFVREDGREIVGRKLDNVGGCGIRIYPRQQMARLGFRPADEDRKRACDTSIITNMLRNSNRLVIEHVPIDPRQIVDWKSPSTQLNSYEALRRYKTISRHADPFAALEDFYPADALEAMRDHYAMNNNLVAA